MGTAPLGFAYLLACRRAPAPDPLFYFAGGPGESAVKGAAGLAQDWSLVNRKRDLVLVDVRGTGGSNALDCKALQGNQGVLGYMESFLPVPGVKACRAELEPRANPALYTTYAAVDDVDDVRAALGYDKIDVTGGSYGTFAGLMYMKRHGEHVRTAVLEGLVPPGTRMPLHFAHDTQVALDQVIAACAKDAECHARARVQRDACAEWPHAPVPAGIEEPVRSDVPTLLISGERDPVTPAYWADRAARTLPRSVRIVVPGGGHGNEGLKGVECLDALSAAFVESGTEKGLDTSCVSKIRPLPFAVKDERTPEAKLSSAELDAFAGTYSGGNGTEMVVLREGNVLKVDLGGPPPFVLAPIGPARFKILGAPSGYFVVFERERGTVSGMVLEEGADVRETLKRTSASPSK